MFPFIQCQCFDKRRCLFSEKNQRFIKIRVHILARNQCFRGHLDRLYSRYGFRGTLEQFLKERHRPALSSFRGCLTVFCDPDFYQRNDSEVLRILKEAMVFGAVGCHPGQAYWYSYKTGCAMESLLRHPKIIAIGEMGLVLDFSFHHLKKNPKHSKGST